jgi:lysophospholipid acyltransferase
MSFTVAPFVILHFYDTILVWARVYFYGIVAVTASFAFFASPAKGVLVRNLNKRNKPSRTVSEEPAKPPTLGLPSDPGREIEEAMQEIMSEIETRRGRGSQAEMPTGRELKAVLETKLGRKI